MQQNNMFKPNPPDAMDLDSIPSIFDHKKSIHQPIVMNKPSNFSIEHILSSAGSRKDKHVLDCSKRPKDEIKPLYTDRSECYIMDNNVVHQYPPILNWLQYTRYKPPRLPSKCKIFQ